jgi:hypothetical protein
MDGVAFELAIKTLGLSSKEAAKLLSVDLKTVTRWIRSDVAIPGSVIQVLDAWRKLQLAKIPWRPNGLPLNFLDEKDIQEQIRLLREHSMDLAEVLQRVAQRGGPAAPWEVDLERREAKLAGTMYVYFYPLSNGSFSPSSYYREDKEPNLHRDQPLIDDAIACIAEAIGAAGPKWAEGN